MMILFVMMFPVSCGKKQSNQNNSGGTSEIDVDLTVLDPVIYSGKYHSLGKLLGNIGDFL